MFTQWEIKDKNVLNVSDLSLRLCRRMERGKMMDLNILYDSQDPIRGKSRRISVLTEQTYVDNIIESSKKIYSSQMLLQRSRLIGQKITIVQPSDCYEQSDDDQFHFIRDIKGPKVVQSLL